MLIVLVSIIAVLGILVLNKQAAIQTTNMDIQNIESEADEIAKQNVDLTVRVSELSTYENIWKKSERTRFNSK
ncbi:hypothetical protein OL548_11765 [Lysinibacillus sp. MHQ-1]|nr:hypothetical protein OL548_11765 [Lysinibacillus sp. MHQ-1]